MKLLNRILLINWHSYSYEIIPVKKITFLTGKTAAGKSTIIDALQLVMLADTQGSSFNKAASQKSARTLRGYLYGEQGDDGDTGARFLRSGGSFSSYVVLEFLDDTNGKYLTAGFAADCYSDLNYSSRWFILYGSGIPENNFLSDGIPMTLDKLKAFLKRNSGIDSYDFFDTNKAYIGTFLSRLGVDERYSTLLRKAVPFIPITNITHFITESICESDNTIDVETMSADIRSYRILEHEVALMERKIAELESIEDVYSEIVRIRERLEEADYIEARADLEDMDSEIEKLKAELKKAEDSLSSLEYSLAEKKSEEEKLTAKLEDDRKKLYSSDIYNAKAHLEADLKVLSFRIDTIRRDVEGIAAIIRQSAQHYLAAVNAGLKAEKRELNLLLSASEVGRDSVRSISMKEYSALTSRLFEVFSNLKTTLSARKRELEKAIEDKKVLVLSLERGIKPYPAETLAFIREFEEGTGETPLVLADLVEVVDESWRSALESYLGADRFTLIVSKEKLSFAREIAERFGDVRIYDGSQSASVSASSALSLIEVDKRAESLVSLLLGSLSVGVEEGARWLLESGTFCRDGEVIRAIAQDTFLGREAAIIMLENERRELASLDDELEELVESLSRLASTVTASDIISEQNVGEYSAKLSLIDEIPSLSAEVEKIKDQLNSLDLDMIAELEKSIRAGEKAVSEIRRVQEQLTEKKGEAVSDIRRLKDGQIPSLLARYDSIDNEIREKFSSEWIDSVGAEKYREARNRERTTLSLRETYLNQSKRYRTMLGNCFSALVEKRTRYNSSHLASYDAKAEDNNAYASELVKLKDNQLPLYSERIKEAKERAYRQFRENFISRIKSNIENIEKTIRTLNHTLSDFRFGTDKYRFEVSPNKDYLHFYQMFTDEMLMQNTDNLFASSFEDKYKNEINDLFSALIYDKSKASAEDQKEHERKIALYTDYRTYLTFDLCVTDTDGNTQRLSKTLLTKSGGETQLPFYIGLLASFSQVCKIKSRIQNNTVRLIILDEAFSKMDGERIKESIRLLKDFGLQAIFSAPPEKIGDITPLVDETILIMKEHGKSYAKEFIQS